jgi:hypothetical protein
MPSSRASLTFDFRLRHGMHALLMHFLRLDAEEPSSVGDADGVRASILGTSRRRLLGLGCDMTEVWWYMRRHSASVVGRLFNPRS